MEIFFVLQLNKPDIMKRIILSAIVLLFLGAAGISQTLGTENLYQKYKGEKGIVSVWIPGAVMKFASAVADLDKEEAALLRSIKSIRVLTIEDTERYEGVNFVREAKFREGQSGYATLMQVTDGGEDVMILGKEKNGKLKNLLILVGGEENVMVHIKGRLNADMLGSIAGVAGLDEIDVLSAL